MTVEEPKRADLHNPQNPAHNPNTGGAPRPAQARSEPGAESPPASPPKVAIVFVVQGGEVAVDIDPSRPIRECIGLALKKSSIAGGPGEWTARTTEGRMLDSGKSPVEEGIDGPARLYLNRGPGRGG